MRDSSISLAARAVWVIIDGISEDYKPTLSQWLQMSGVTRNTWRRCVRELAAHGWLTYDTEGNRTVYRTTTKGVQAKKPPLAEHVVSDEEKPVVPDPRARLRNDVTSDMMVEIGCRSVGISADEYRRLAQEIFNDWAFQDLDPREWTKSHFLGVLRIKVKEKNRKNGQQKQPTTGPDKARADERRRGVDHAAAPAESYTGGKF